MDCHGLMQIGEVSERTGLSLRTIRYYEEVGLVVPSARSQGGFRLYTDPDLQRLHTIKRMKPLELTLEQMRELLDILDRLATGVRLSKSERTRLAAALSGYRDAIRGRCETLREQLATAEAFGSTLAAHLDTLNPAPTVAGQH